MESFLVKFKRVLSSGDIYTRTVQAINKSPLRYATKLVMIAIHFKTFLKRKRLEIDFNLSAQEYTVLESLRQHGYAELSDLVSQEKLSQLLIYGDEKLKRIDSIRQFETTKTKDFWVRLSDEDIGDREMTTDNPMVQIALTEPVLRIAGSYLKQAPFLEYVLLTMSQFSGSELKSSQLWHLDRDNTTMLKFFVYLTDVESEADGPFTFFDKKLSSLVKNSFFLRHLPDNEIYDQLPQEKKTQLIRKRLSCFIVDTSRCYHMGSRVFDGHRRLLFTSLYIGLPSNYPWSGKEKYRIVDGEKLSELQYSALRSH